jgi:hypothetical protein
MYNAALYIIHEQLAFRKSDKQREQHNGMSLAATQIGISNFELVVAS